MAQLHPSYGAMMFTNTWELRSPSIPFHVEAPFVGANDLMTGTLIFPQKSQIRQNMLRKLKTHPAAGEMIKFDQCLF